MTPKTGELRSLGVNIYNYIHLHGPHRQHDGCAVTPAQTYIPPIARR